MASRLSALIIVGAMIGARAQNAPKEIILVEANAVSQASVAKWKEEKFKGVAIVLDEPGDRTLRRAAGAIAAAELDLYWWIEVGRNPKMAAANPRWMASLGMHADWQKRFPNAPEPGVNQVAKAFPWVPIAYAEAFDAHLKRIEELCKDLPPGAQGLFLNDLQAGPGSCGCGNVQCRWAVDYHVSPTTRKMTGTNVAGRFVAESRKRTNLPIVPVWTSECEESDMPSDKNRGKPSTGLCGSVGCATGACPMEFAGQLSELLSAHEGPVALLAVHNPLERTREQFGGGPTWVINALGYVHKTLATEGRKPFPKERLWAVVEGTDAGKEGTAREAAARAGATTVIVARTAIDQSYEPRLLRKE